MQSRSLPIFSHVCVRLFVCVYVQYAFSHTHSRAIQKRMPRRLDSRSLPSLLSVHLVRLKRVINCQQGFKKKKSLAAKCLLDFTLVEFLAFLTHFSDLFPPPRDKHTPPAFAFRFQTGCLCFFLSKIAGLSPLLLKVGAFCSLAAGKRTDYFCTNKRLN